MRLTVVVISQYLQMLDHYITSLKLMLHVNSISIEKKKKDPTDREEGERNLGWVQDY